MSAAEYFKFLHCEWDWKMEKDQGKVNLNDNDLAVMINNVLSFLEKI